MAVKKEYDEGLERLIDDGSDSMLDLVNAANARLDCSKESYAYILVLTHGTAECDLTVALQSNMSREDVQLVLEKALHLATTGKVQRVHRQ